MGAEQEVVDVGKGVMEFANVASLVLLIIILGLLARVHVLLRRIGRCQSTRAQKQNQHEHESDEDEKHHPHVLSIAHVGKGEEEESNQALRCSTLENERQPLQALETNNVRSLAEKRAHERANEMEKYAQSQKRMLERIERDLANERTRREHVEQQLEQLKAQKATHSSWLEP